MFCFVKISIYLFLCIKLKSSAPVNTELQLIQILFRHGDRSAVNSYPTDPYNETAWAKYGGFGQLTQIGMDQHNNYGRFLRDRYFGVLDKFYSKNKVAVRSTDYDRTLMSAYSLLSGLFQPVDYQIWNRKINWQPIAVHTTEASTDMIFYSRECPRYLQLKSQVVNSSEYKELNSQYKQMFDIINTNGGTKNMNLIDLWKIGDVLFCQKTHGFTLPDWVGQVYDEMIAALKWGFYFDYRSTEMAKLTSGGILNDMRKNILNKIRNNSPSQLYLYSGHDTYVAGLVKLLNLTEINQPPYASSVILELRKQINVPNYFIQVFYKNNTANEPINFQLMTIYGCDSLCPFDKFLQIIDNLVVVDFPAACKIQ